jgi:hypothetical protein
MSGMGKYRSVKYSAGESSLAINKETDRNLAETKPCKVKGAHVYGRHPV